MNVLQNAVDAISLGMEDYNNPDPRRILSSTRNLFSGILLLFKEKLRRLSPPGTDEILIKRMIVPNLDQDAKVIWQGRGSKTVDVQGIKDRFEALGIAVDWKRVNAVNNYRNDIEHYYSTATAESARTMIANCFIVIRDFVRSHLDEDPLSLFGSSTWGTMSNVAEVYETEKAECEKRIEGNTTLHVTLSAAILAFGCPDCGSGLIDIEEEEDSSDPNFRCRSCGRTWNFFEMAEDAIVDYFGNPNWLSVTDGAEPATITCPSCQQETYVLDDDECVSCGERVERVRNRCSDDIPPEELDGSGLCSYCAHIMSKDD